MKPNAKVFIGGKYQDVGAVKAQNNPQWLRDILTAEEAGSANPTLYSKSSWAYSCINIRADALSGIPWEVRKKAKGEEQGDVVDESHELVKTLTEVNPEMNWIDLARATEADLNVNGKAYWLKVHPGKQQKVVVGLQRLNPNKMEAKTTRAGISHFEFEIGGKKEDIAREEIVFFRLYDPRDDFGAIPPLEVARADIEAEASADAYLADFFQNYAMPAHIINFQDGNIDKAELRRSERRWLARLRGKDNRHKVKFTSTAEMQIETLGYSIKDLAMGEVREEARRAICAAFRVPMTMAGASESANYATKHESRKSLYTETIIPRSEYIEGVINAELVVPHFDTAIEFVFRPDKLAVMQPDKKDEAERVSMLVDSGTITPEAGALSIGFTKEDVGPGPFIQMMPGTVEELEKAEEIAAGGNTGKSALLAELRAYKKFRIKRGKNGREFKTDIIPASLMGYLEGRLKDVETEDAIDRVFQSAMTWSDYP